MAADSPAWPSTIKLGMNLVAAHYATSFHTVHTRVLLYPEFKVLIGYWLLFGWRSWIAFHFPLPKKAAMLSQPVIEFTTRRAPQEAVVNITWVELHIMFAPLPFFMEHPFKVKFLLWASIRTRTSVSVSVYQSASHCHSCAHAEHGEQYAFQPLPHRTVPQEQGLWSLCVCV